MEVLVKVLYVVSTGLMVPVVAALLGLVAWATLHVGGLVGERRDRRRGHRRLRDAIQELKRRHGIPHRDQLKILAAVSEVGGPVGDFVRDTLMDSPDEVVLGKIVDDIHIEMDGRTSRVALGTRLGPMLGLMGTLIPMGPALTGLSAGDVAGMSRNLVLAFSTTVLGLLAGGVCYVVAVVRARWHAQDMSDIEFIHDLMLKAEKGASHHGSTHV